jgi:hypothetical protein
MFTTRPEIRGMFGAISTTHWIATAVGMSVLERGGNAFDAAAAGFVLSRARQGAMPPGGLRRVLSSKIICSRFARHWSRHRPGAPKRL